MAPGLPTREEIEAWLVALEAGSRSRDEADRWAAQRFNLFTQMARLTQPFIVHCHPESCVPSVALR